MFSKAGEPNPQIRFEGFVKMSDNLKELRKSQLVTVDRFLRMSKGANTIILDTRSKSAFDKVHIKGATHLNFSDFTAVKLRKVIPDKNTRILIYCNNNFRADKPKLKVEALQAKSPALALNIPTYVNLHGYGYKNVYELSSLLPLSKAGVPLEGSDIDPETGIFKQLLALGKETQK